MRKFPPCLAYTKICASLFYLFLGPFLLTCWFDVAKAELCSPFTAKYCRTDFASSQWLRAGVPFHRWFFLCREKFLVTNELTLRAHQTEFRDHQLLKSRRSTDGQDCLYIPLQEEDIEKLIEDIQGWCCSLPHYLLVSQCQSVRVIKMSLFCLLIFCDVEYRTRCWWFFSDFPTKLFTKAYEAYMIVMTFLFDFTNIIVNV